MHMHMHTCACTQSGSVPPHNEQQEDVEEHLEGAVAEPVPGDRRDVRSPVVLLVGAHAREVGAKATADAGEDDHNGKVENQIIVGGRAVVGCCALPVEPHLPRLRVPPATERVVRVVRADGERDRVDVVALRGGGEGATALEWHSMGVYTLFFYAYFFFVFCLCVCVCAFWFLVLFWALFVTGSHLLLLSTGCCSVGRVSE